MGKRGDLSLPVEKVMEEVEQFFMGLGEDDLIEIDEPQLVIAKRLKLPVQVVLLTLKELHRQRRIGLLEFMGSIIIAPEQGMLKAPSVFTTQGTKVKAKDEPRYRQNANTDTQEEAPMSEVDKLHEQIAYLTRRLEAATRRASKAEAECDSLRQSLDAVGAARAQTIQSAQVLKEEVASLSPLVERVEKLEQRIAVLTAQQNVPDELAKVIKAIT